jgi:hypothetical protein
MGSNVNAGHREPWNKGKIVGQKAPFKVKDIWALRVRLQLEDRVRELALFISGSTASCADVTSLASRSRTSATVTKWHRGRSSFSIRPVGTCARPAIRLSGHRRIRAHRRDDETRWGRYCVETVWSTVEDFESQLMKSAPFVWSSTLLLTLAACSKQPQDAAPPSTTTAPASFATPASDPSLPSASVVASAPDTPVDAPASAPAGMPMPSSGPAAASAASAP